MALTAHQKYLSRLLCISSIIPLLILQCSCSSVSTGLEHQTGINRIALVVTDQSPEIRFDGFSRSKGEGALDTMGAAFGGSLQGRELGILLLPVTLPVAATIGAISAPSADRVKQAELDWSRRIDKQKITSCLPDAVVNAAKADGINWQPALNSTNHTLRQPADYKQLVDAGINRALELSILSITGRGDDLDAPLELKMHARARLLNTIDSKEIFKTDAIYTGHRHTRQQWTADDSNLLLSDLVSGCEALGRHFYEQIFMLYRSPDRSWFSLDKPAGVLPTDPPPGFFVPIVPSSRPTFRWNRFPQDTDLNAEVKETGQIKNVSYDLFIAELHGSKPETVYQRSGITQTYHTVELQLNRKTSYIWSVRARFELNNRQRITEWGRRFLPDRQLQYLPPSGAGFYPFETD